MFTERILFHREQERAERLDEHAGLGLIPRSVAAELGGVSRPAAGTGAARSRSAPQFLWPLASSVGDADRGIAAGAVKD